MPKIKRMISICIIVGCTKKAHARSWCNMHYSRWHTYGNPTAIVRSRDDGNPIHGLRHHSAYETWKNMMGRCYSPARHNFAQYGGRRIRVEPRWHDVRNFVTDMGLRRAGYSIERRDNNRDYSPDNCYWLLTKLQYLNKRPRNSRNFSVNKWAL